MAKIQWEYPQPANGIQGAFDRFIGPGATNAEILLEIGVSAAAAIAIVFYAITQGLNWTLLQLIIAAVLALDLTGGVVTNATSTAKRWYHRPGQGFVQHMGFIALHALQPLLVVFFFRSGDWGFFVLVYGYLLAASLLILWTPLYLRRPVAFTLLMGAFVLNSYLIPPTPGLEWFLPVFYLKLLVSHLLREEPYR